uniref:carbohydrate ABC transporter permease n=1 Tax=Enterocloster clostridioformis TaxID=1531 RepID=UPI001C3DD005|nr:carbohydrate ABC transporter permease [Enterocloster clostridioformis]
MNRKEKKAKRRWNIWVLALIIIAVGALFFVPIYAMIIISLKTTRELIYSPLGFPRTLYLENFKDAWKMLNLGTVYKNSLMVAYVSVIARILMASMASFTLAKRVNRVNRFLYVLFLSGLMIPIYTVLVPLLRLIKNLGLINSHLGLIVVYIAMGMPFAIFMLTGFVKAIPNELLEAAVLDGCSVYRTFWTIIFPLLKSAVTTLFILDFLSVWNDFLLPMLTLADNSLKTVTVAMYNFYGEFGSRWEMTFAGYTLAIIPIVIVYLLLQKNIVEGIMIGAVKG